MAGASILVPSSHALSAATLSDNCVDQLLCNAGATSTQRIVGRVGSGCSCSTSAGSDYEDDEEKMRLVRSSIALEMPGCTAHAASAVPVDGLVEPAGSIERPCVYHGDTHCAAISSAIEESRLQIPDKPKWILPQECTQPAGAFHDDEIVYDESSSPIRIKNTFIESDFDCKPFSLDGFFQEREIRSCPVSRPPSFDDVGTTLESLLEAIEEASPCRTSAVIEPVTCTHPADAQYAQLISILVDTVSWSNPTIPAPPAYVAPELAAVGVPPPPPLCPNSAINELEFGSVELPSLGSAAHHLGKCKPCVFLHKTGCSAGKGCDFCHLCDAGEKNRRRIERKDQIRLSKLSKASCAETSSTAVLAPEMPMMVANSMPASPTRNFDSSIFASMPSPALNAVILPQSMPTNRMTLREELQRKGGMLLSGMPMHGSVSPIGMMLPR